LIVLFAGALIAQAGPRAATSIRYSVDAAMTPAAYNSAASGRVQAYSKKVGPSNHHRLRIHAAGLDPKTDYTVLAQIGDDTRFVVVTNFTTGPRGTARVVYVNTSSVSSRRALPEMLNPVSSVRAIAIADSNGNVVLSTDLHHAESMQFELTSIFDNTGNDAAAIGCVAVACQGGGVQFRLFAAGQSSQFTFCVNDAPVETYTAGVTGISVGAWPGSAPSPLDPPQSLLAQLRRSGRSAKRRALRPASIKLDRWQYAPANFLVLCRR